jgi:adenylate cyclase
VFAREVGQRPRHGAAYQIAETYAWRGEIDRAFDWLERAYVRRDPGLSNTATDPWFPPLHGDPRWLPFVQKMGLV